MFKTFKLAAIIVLLIGTAVEVGIMATMEMPAEQPDTQTVLGHRVTPMGQVQLVVAQ